MSTGSGGPVVDPLFRSGRVDSECSWGEVSSSPVPGVVPVVLVDSSSVPVSTEVVDQGFRELSEALVRFRNALHTTWNVSS